MKKQTKKQKLNDLFDAFKCLQKSVPVKRSRAKDGSVSTHPTVEVEPLLEKHVLTQCLAWLQGKGLQCWRHDCGTFQNSRGEWGTYGIKGGGDIMGLLRNGIHFEIEAKNGKGGRLSVKQQQHMKEVLSTNGLYFVVHGVQELEYYFGEYVL